MATVNKRVGIPQAVAINGVDAGGVMRAEIQAGYDQIVESEPDGLEAPISDRGVQFVRGTIVTQDWIEAVNLLAGTVGTYVFYERKSGVAAATGYVKHTLTNPVIHNVKIDFAQGRYGTVSLDFECKAADETKTIADMHGMTDDQAAPTYVSAARGGWRISSAVLNPGASEVDIYHLTAFSFGLKLGLAKACNDADVAYTCVDARLDGVKPAGSITFQDSGVTAAQLKAQQLALHARASLVVTVVQSGGATAKTLTVAGVVFDSFGSRAASAQDFDDFTMPFRVANDTGTPLTLAGANKILTIADAA